MTRHWAAVLMVVVVVAPGSPVRGQAAYDPGPPPPLPPLVDEPLTERPATAPEDRIDQQAPVPGYSSQVAAAPISPLLGYSIEQRTAWLEQCRNVYGASPRADICGDYLTRYEQAYLDYLEAARARR